MLKFTRARWFAVAPLAAVCTLSVFHTADAAKAPACQRAAEWVSDHRGALPSTLEAISKYPTIYQRTIYGNLEPSQRIAIWREKLTRHLSTASLTNRQLVAETAMLSRLEEYASDPAGIMHAARLAKDGVADGLIRAFGGPAARDLFDVIDARADRSPAATALVAPLHEAGIASGLLDAVSGIGRILGVHKAPKLTFSSCSCYSGDPLVGCPFSEQCKTPQGTDDCSPPIGDFCGQGMDQPCDGLCY